MALFTLPSAEGGVTITTFGQPAIFAGTASIRTVEGYAAVPPGTYRPTVSMGITFCPIMIPFSSFIIKLFLTCFS